VRQRWHPEARGSSLRRRVDRQAEAANHPSGLVVPPGLGEHFAVSYTREVREVREVRCDVPWPGRPQVSMSAHLLGMTPGTPRFGLTHAGQSFLTNQWCVLPMPRAPLMDRLHRMRTAAVRPRTRCVGANRIRSSQNQRRIRCCIHG
jgi:hypothetical protein